MIDDPPTMDPFLECQEQMRNFEINDRPPSFRHSRAFRNFKNPPQPHMCIRDMTAEGDQEVLINVMSWTRIVKPQTPNDPIPLYGGMRVLASSSSNRSPTQQQQNPAMLFAVMANPEVLKKASRNSVDDQDLTALVELMCEFVEAMNPGLKLLRQPVVLKDRDLSGELKNIWGAVQAKRETEREQFMTGKNNPNLVVYTELGPETAVGNRSPPDENGHCLAEDNHNSIEHHNGRSLAVNGRADKERQGEADYSATVDQADDCMKENGIASSLGNHININNAAQQTPLSSNDLSSLSLARSKNNSSEGLQGDRIRTVDVNGTERNNHQEQHQNHNASVSPHGASCEASGGLTNSTETTTPTIDTKVPEPVVAAESAPPVSVVPVQILGKGSGKAEKEVANVKEKKEKSISGFLHSGLFGKRNKDKDSNGATKEKSNKPKLGSFKNRLMMSSNKEKEDKGSEAGAKKITLPMRGGGPEETNPQFSKIGQSMTTAK